MNLEPKLENIAIANKKESGNEQSIGNSNREDNQTEELHSEELQQENLQRDHDVLKRELFQKYGQAFWDLGDKKKFPLEINEKVRSVITDPKDWATYFRFAQAAYVTRSGAKYEKPQGHPNIMHPSEKTIEKIEVNIADSSTREKYIENWPYKDFSLDEWEENGFLITKEGLPSKLEREYYELVRTGDFKKWFGDWEDHSDDQEVSKMIDPDTKEPKVFYRGDKSRFKPGFIVLDDDGRTPDIDKLKLDEEGNPVLGEGNPILGIEREKALSRRQGVFFTNNKKVALDYGVDIDANTLGKTGLESERDHPETFPKMKDWLESFANSSPNFWKNITQYILDYSPEIEADDYRHRFHVMCYDMRIMGKNEDDLWDEVTNQRRHEKPSYYIDIFIKSGNFERLIDGFNSYVKDESDNSFKKSLKSNEWHKPEWMLQFRKLRLDYLTEPLVLSTVFIRSKNPRIERRIDVTENSDVHWARKDGHDSFINKEGVGGIKEADEIVMFDLKNIWVAKKEHLDYSDVERVDKVNGITRL
ncbi:MAG: hypothetical protein WC022_00590 [Parcubacteria group bacterium]